MIMDQYDLFWEWFLGGEFGFDAIAYFSFLYVVGWFLQAEYIAALQLQAMLAETRMVIACLDA